MSAGGGRREREKSNMAERDELLTVELICDLFLNMINIMVIEKFVIIVVNIDMS